LYVDGKLSAAVGMPGVHIKGSEGGSGGSYGLDNPFIFPRPWPSTLHFGSTTSLTEGGGSDTNDAVTPFTGIVSGVHLQLNLHRQGGGDGGSGNEGDAASLELEHKLVKEFSNRDTASAGGGGSGGGSGGGGSGGGGGGAGADAVRAMKPLIPPIPRMLWPGDSIKIRKAEEEEEMRQKDEKEAEEKAKQERTKRWTDLQKANAEAAGDAVGDAAGDTAGAKAKAGSYVKGSAEAIDAWFRSKETVEERTVREQMEARELEEKRKREEARAQSMEPEQAIATGMIGPAQLFQLATDYRIGNWSCVLERVARGRARSRQHGGGALLQEARARRRNTFAGGSGRGGDGGSGRGSRQAARSNEAMADADRESDWSWHSWRPCVPDTATAHIALLMSALSTSLVYAPRFSSFPPRMNEVTNLTEFRSFAALAHVHHTG
jgi:hypothetical protein